MNYKKSILYSLFITILFFAGVHLLLSVHFNEIDDVQMMMIANGYYGEPIEYLIFINILVGKLLLTLYNSAPNIEWYSVYHLSCLFFSLWSLIAFVLGKITDRKTSIVFVLLILGVGFHFFYTWQFTTTASLSATAGFLYLHYFFRSRNATSGKVAYSNLVIALFLLLLSSTLRFQVTVMIGAISFPYFIYKLVQNKKVADWVICSGIFLLVVGLEFFHKQSYKGEWGQYLEWTYARGANLSENAHVFHSLNYVKQQEALSTSNYRLARNFWFSDYFTLSNLKKLGSFTRKEVFSSNPKYLYPKFFIEDNLIRILFFTAFSIIIFLGLDKPNKYQFIASITFIGAIFTYLMFVMVIKSRVFSSILIFHSLFAMYLLHSQGNALKAKYARLLALLAIPLLLLQGKFVYEQEQANRNVLKRHKEIAEKLEADKVYVPGILPFVMKHCRPFEKDYLILKEKNVLFAGWLWHSPVLKKAFEAKLNRSDEKFGTPILKNFAFDEKVRLICNQYEMELLTKYYKEDLNLESDVKEILKGVYLVHPLNSSDE